MAINPVQRQSLLTFGSIVAVTAIGFISTFYFAHYLGPAILGTFFLFLAYYGIFDLISDGGFSGAAVKRISEGRLQSEYYTAYFILRLVLLCFSVAVFVLISPYISEFNGNDLFSWFILALVVGTFYNFTTTNLFGTAQVGVMQTTTLFNTIVKTLVQILAVFLGFGIGGLVAGFIAGMIAAAILNMKFLQLSLSRCNRSHIESLLSFSVWTFLSSGGFLSFTYADTILIGYLMSETDVGIYRVAFQLTSVSSFMVIALHNVLYPRISRWHSEKKISLIEYSLSRSFTYSLLLAIPVTAGGAILADKLLYFLYGASFVPGATVFIILLFMQIANIFMFLQTSCLNAMDRPRISFYVTATSAILNIVLNILLIPDFGIAGAGLASLVTMSVNAVLAYLALKSSLHIRIDAGSVMNMIISAIIMSAFVIGYMYVISIRDFISLGLSIGIGAIIYFLVLLLIDKTIRSELKELLDTMNIPLIPG